MTNESGKKDAAGVDCGRDAGEKVSSKCEFRGKDEEAVEMVLARFVREATFLEENDCHPLARVPRIAMDSLTIGKKLGNGGYCHVLEARHDEENKSFALKRLRRDILDDETEREHGITDLAQEAAILANLQEHPHVIRLYGIVEDHNQEEEEGNGFFLLLERLSETLDHRIHHTWKKEQEEQAVAAAMASKNSKNSIFSSFSSSSQRHQLQAYQYKALHHRLRVAALPIAETIAYLHSLGIMYRDVKPDNIGFLASSNDKDSGVIKLFDFGLSTCQQRSREQVGSHRYMAPEVMMVGGCAFRRNGSYNRSIDVYSFGMLLFELCALAKPFGHVFCEKEHAQLVLHQQERPKPPTWWPKKLRKLMQQCWSRNPRVRPGMDQVVSTLQTIIMQEAGVEEAIKNKRKNFFHANKKRLSSPILSATRNASSPSNRKIMVI